MGIRRYLSTVLPIMIAGIGAFYYVSRESTQSKIRSEVTKSAGINTKSLEERQKYVSDLTATLQAASQKKVNFIWEHEQRIIDKKKH